MRGALAAQTAAGKAPGARGRLRGDLMRDAMRVTRFVPGNEPGNFLGRDVNPGEVFWTFDGVTYGSCDEETGIVLIESSFAKGPFFEFPRDAVEVWQ